MRTESELMAITEAGGWLGLSMEERFAVVRRLKRHTFDRLEAKETTTWRGRTRRRRKPGAYARFLFGMVRLIGVRFVAVQPAGAGKWTT